MSISREQLTCFGKRPVTKHAKSHTAAYLILSLHIAL